MNKLGFFYVVLFLISFSTFSQNDSLKESQKYHVKILILNQFIDSANDVLEDFKNTYNYLTEDSIFYAYQKELINREKGNYESATNSFQEILQFYGQTGNIESNSKQLLTWLLLMTIVETTTFQNTGIKLVLKSLTINTTLKHTYNS